MEEDFDVKMRKKYGAPFVDMHRVDLQKCLYSKALELGVDVRLGARVSNVDCDAAEIYLESGEKVAGDLIVAADGLWSRCRESFLRQKDQPLPTGDLAYRIVLTLDQISDPELREWISKPSVHFWVGPGSHAVGYSLRASTMYNIVLLCPDNLPKDVARQSGSVEEMRQLFSGWDPLLTRFLNHVDSVDKWKLMHRPELESWTNAQGNFVLIGDSCHPMLPYLAQGANSSIEDGGVLGRLLSAVESKSQLQPAVKLYEQLRKSRSEAIVRETFHQVSANACETLLPFKLRRTRREMHFICQTALSSKKGTKCSLHNSERRSRGNFRADGKTPLLLPACSLIARRTCPQVQPWLYGYDAYQEADAALLASPLSRKKMGITAWLWQYLSTFQSTFSKIVSWLTSITLK